MADSNGVEGQNETGSRDINKKRGDYLSWPDYFMAVASLSAMRSKDPCSQVGRIKIDNITVLYLKSVLVLLTECLIFH